MKELLLFYFICLIGFSCGLLFAYIYWSLKVSRLNAELAIYKTFYESAKSVRVKVEQKFDKMMFDAIKGSNKGE